MSGNRIERQVEALLDDAEEAMRRGSWRRVEMLAGAAARLDPHNRDARVYLDAARLERGRLRRALREVWPASGLDRLGGSRRGRRAVTALGRRAGRTLMAGFTMLGGITFALIVLTSALSSRSATPTGERSAPVTTGATSPLSAGASQASAGEAVSATAVPATPAPIESTAQRSTPAATAPAGAPGSVPAITPPDPVSAGPPTAEPVPPSTVTYVVQPGDSLLLVASRHGVTVDELLALNRRSIDDWLFEGEVILIPEPVPSE